MVGRAKRKKSFISTLLPLKSRMYFSRTRATLLVEASTRQMHTSTQRAMTVAMATPLRPMGSPNQPKINAAFSSTFRPKEIKYVTVLSITRSTLRMMFRYAMEKPEST